MDVHDWFAETGVKELANAVDRMKTANDNDHGSEIADVAYRSEWDIFLDALRRIFADPHYGAQRAAIEAILTLDQDADTLERMRSAAATLLSDGDELLAFETRRDAWRCYYRDSLTEENCHETE